MNFLNQLPIPRVLYRTSSEFSEDIVVLQDGPLKRLKVNRVTQSVDHRTKYAQTLIWGQLVEVIKTQAPYAKKILILGLGGGTVQHMLSEQLPEAKITSVEIDPTIVDVAKQYFDLEKIPNHEVIVNDACRVLVEPEKFNISYRDFDVALVDIYVGEKFPDLGGSGTFLANLTRMVAQGGLVVINRMYQIHHQEEVDAFLDNVKDFIADVETVTVPGKTNSDNLIIYGKAS